MSEIGLSRAELLKCGGVWRCGGLWTPCTAIYLAPSRLLHKILHQYIALSLTWLIARNNMAPSNVLQPLQEAQNTSEMPKHEAFNHEYVLADLAQTPTEQQHNLVYDNDEEEPKIDARTWMACAAMLLLNLVLTFALQGPPVVVSRLSPSNRDILIKLTLSPSFRSLQKISTAHKKEPGCSTHIFLHKPS